MRLDNTCRFNAFTNEDGDSFCACAIFHLISTSWASLDAWKTIGHMSNSTDPDGRPICSHSASHPDQSCKSFLQYYCSSLTTHQSFPKVTPWTKIAILFYIFYYNKTFINHYALIHVQDFNKISTKLSRNIISICRLNNNMNYCTVLKQRHSF